MSKDTKLDCEYGTWFQRYVVAALIFLTKNDAIYAKDTKECDFAGFDCNTDDVVHSVAISKRTKIIP